MTDTQKKVQFTAQQEEAIITRVGEVLVSAAAGSGKTAVLIERIVSIILIDRVAVDQLVVLTFTNAAATQMRERLRARLQKALQEQPKDASYIKRQLLLLPAAHISTFHAFCIQILRNNYQYTKLSPTFKVGEENEMSLLKEATLDTVLEELFEEKDPNFMLLANSFVTGVRIQELRKIILSVYEKSRAFSHPQQWREQALEWVRNEVYIKKLIMLHQEDIQKKLSNLMSELANCQLLLSGFPKNQAACDYFSEQLYTIQEHIAGDMNTVKTQWETIDILKWPTIKKDEKTAETELAHQVYTKLKKQYQKMADSLYTDAQISEQQAKTQPTVEALLLAVTRFEQLFSTEKQQKDIADFSDLEHYMIQLLEEHELVRLTVSEHITEILVDEYQDTNGVQDTIIYALKRKENRIFMVGDLKQSIYRFRLADPTIFMHKQKLFAENSPENQLILLNKNFRSTSTILETVNTICEPLFQLDIEYTDSNRLYHGNLSYQPADDLETTWHIFAEVAKDQFAEQFTTEEEQKALYITRQVQELVQNRKIFDLKTGDYRAITLDDIAILFRNKTTTLVQAIEQAFEKYGIHYSSAIDKGYFDAAEVNNVLALLTVLDNPYNTISLLAYMRSQLCFFSDEELVEIKMLASDACEKNAEFYEYLLYIISTKNESELALKIDRMLQQLEHFREKLMVMPISRVIRYIYEETVYYELVATLPNGHVRQANLDILCSLAKSREQLGMNSLRSFNRYMKNLQKNNRDFAIAKQKESREASIEMMTIHKSKGLEFPIVFLVDVDRRFNKQDSRAPYQMSEDEGLALRYTDLEKKIRYKTWHYQYIAQQQAMADIAEQLRVLYVALTRPMQQLHLFLDETTKEYVQAWREEDVLNMQSFGEGLSYAYQVMATKKDLNWQTKIVDLTTLEGTMPQQLQKETGQQVDAVTEADVLQLLAKIQEKYKYENLQQYAQKQTVTEIKRREDEKNEEQPFSFEKHLDAPIQGRFGAPRRVEENLKLSEEVPSFMKQEQVISALSRGTLYHFILQQYQWKKPQKVEKMLEEMLAVGIITKQEQDILNTQKIEAIIQHIQETYLDNNYQIAGKEVPFSLKYNAEELYGDNLGFHEEQLLVQGKIDLLLVKDEEYLIIDYKTDSLRKNQNEADLTKKYERQLSLYEMAVKKFYNTDKVTSKIYAIFG